MNAILNSVFKNWKTSLAGLAAGALIIAGSSYQSGMSFKQWGAAVAVALLGLLAKDHNN